MIAPSLFSALTPARYRLAYRAVMATRTAMRADTFDGGDAPGLYGLSSSRRFQLDLESIAR